jgi:hypothetical protein
LLEHFSEQFLNYDNKFLQTFITLFKNPESVIASYIDGTRKKYVNVLTYFSIAIMITGLEYFILKRFFPNFLEMSSLGSEGMEAYSRDLVNTILEYQSFVLMFFVPVYAIMARIVFFNLKRFNYTEPLVIFMYILAQLSILGSFITIPSAMLGGNMAGVTPFVLLMQIVYSAYCLKRLYELSVTGILLRTLLFLVVLAVFYILFIILFFTGMALFNPEWLEGLREAQKAVEAASN